MVDLPNKIKAIPMALYSIRSVCHTLRKETVGWPARIGDGRGCGHTSHARGDQNRGIVCVRGGQRWTPGLVGAANPPEFPPRRVFEPLQRRKVRIGGHRESFVVSYRDAVYAWGSNRFGHLDGRIGNHHLQG